MLAHVVLHVTFGGGVAFFLELFIEAVEFFAEATAAGIDAFVAVAHDLQALVAFRTAGIGGLAEVAAVAAFAVLADEHLAFFGVDLEHEFATFWTLRASEVVVAVLLVSAFYRFDEVGSKGAHIAGKVTGLFLATANGFKTFFPLGGEQGRGEVIRYNVDELYTFGGWNELLTLLFHVEDLEKLFNDIGTGSGGTDAAGFVENRLRMFIVHKVLWIFHSGEKGAFSEACRRFGVAFTNGCGKAFEYLPFLEFR